MTENSAIPGFAAQQKAASEFIATMLNGGADPKLMLKAQTDLLESVGKAMTDWLQRSQEAVVDAHQVIARFQAVTTPAELLTVQQEWLAGVFQRMNADATAFQASAMHMVEKSMHGFGRNGATTNDTPEPLVNSSATGPKPMPVPPKAR